MTTSEPDLAVRVACNVASLEPGGAKAILIGAGLGVFSTVYQVTSGRMAVAVKLPRTGPNGDAARESGAYDRERIAYESLLGADLPVPHFYGSVELDSGPAFVLEDLSASRAVDQLDGLSPTEAMAIVDPLFECHDSLSIDRARVLGVRSITPRAFSGPALEAGGHIVSQFDVFARLLAERQSHIDAFAQLDHPVVCHGDPRADNLVLGPTVKLFDWQQISIQAGEADLAWLLATSLEPRVRRVTEADVVARYAVRSGRSFDESWDRYQKSLIVPGLAVLLLAQRRSAGRLARLVETSVERIAAAVLDHDY